MCMSIKGPRGCGKSTRLLQLANDNEGIVVTSSIISARIIAKENGFDKIKDFITYGNYVENIHTYKKDNHMYYIDDIEKLVSYIGNIGAYTSSTD